MQRKINDEQNHQILNKTDKNNFNNYHQKSNTFVQTNKNKKNYYNEQNNINNTNKPKNPKQNQPQQINNIKLRSKNQMSVNPYQYNNFNTEINTNKDGNTKKRTFKGKYRLTTYVPVKYNTVPYFMLVENVRINNDNAKKELKRGKAKDVLNLVLDSLDFLSYVHK